MDVWKRIKRGLALACCLALILGMLGPMEAHAEMGQSGKAITYSSSGSHIGVIDENNTLWMWGSNGSGQLGNGGAANDSRYGDPYQTVPIKVMEDVVSVSCGGSVTAAIKTDRSLWMWGANNYYQLGNGGAGNAKHEEMSNVRDQIRIYQTVPVKVMDDVAAVSCGGNHTAAVKTDGSLWMWGDNTPGALGNNRQYDYIVADYAWNDRHVYQSIPVKVMDGVAAVSCAGSLNCAVTAVAKTDGSLWMFGGNSYGAIGNGGGGDVHVHNLYWAQTVPCKVLDNVVQVTTDGAVTSALKGDGTVWSWGGNPNLVGNGKYGMTAAPAQIAEDVATLGQNAFVKKDGSFWMWGHTIPDLGVKPTYPNSGSESVPLKLLDGGVAFSSDRAIIKTDGTILQWGNVPMGDGTLSGSTDRVGFKKVTQVPNMKVKLTGVQPQQPEAQFTGSGSASLSKLSKKEIADLLASASTQTPDSVFVTAPSCTASYSAGQVKQEVLDAAAKRLSVLRRIAGLPAVTADPALCEQAQYGAVLLAASEFSHTPAQPGDMDSGFYSKAVAATSASNIYAGLSFLSTPDGFMNDSDAGNVSRVGHRRWQLSPKMGKVGFGYTEVSTGYRRYTAEMVFDSSASTTDYDYISWPASGNFPNDLTAFGKDTAWSVSVNPNRYQAPKAADLAVTLTRVSDGRSWSFSGQNQYTAASSGLYFNVDLSNRGINNCIIFRPDGISSYEGVYTVQIDGLRSADGQPASLSYQVDFFKSASYEEQPVSPISFTDVKEDDWFKEYVEKAAAAGLIQGYGNNRFGPDDKLEVCQTLKLAAEIDIKANGGTLPAASGSWYMPYYQYCLNRGIITSEQVKPSDLERAATRYEMVAILDKAVPASRMTPVVTVGTIPDVAPDSQYGSIVYKWYRAGIVEGSGGGYFHGDSTIKRSEVAAILCRINNL